ncbi:TIGR03084 family protein [Gordonia spumicola]|uniref:TIGR03084 family protein n=1 Tax=Gordonia spumicola TaxID=589161 RepID=A0A7I9V338_9ACTN|nr:TIGR03084 family metal-binding protein [Gordonia spumicola]GED99593.1 TIGR03084 family protein [Gordonia spumicola]
MNVVATVVADLITESAELDTVVADMGDDRWQMPTPSPGWTIAHQIAHLHWADLKSIDAIERPNEFSSWIDSIPSHPGAVPAVVDDGAQTLATTSPAALLAAWRDTRAHLAAALSTTDPAGKIPWLGPPMTAASMASARIMETWAHGQDIVDALHITRPATDRLRHVAHIGVRARRFAFIVNGRDPASLAPVFVELDAPDGSWTWGDPDAPERVTGPALDFCLLATQRRHRDDLALTAVGPGADAWLDIAQAFAGPPGQGRPRIHTRT